MGLMLSLLVVVWILIQLNLKMDSSPRLVSIMARKIVKIRVKRI
jgi:hypothetical protein